MNARGGSCEASSSGRRVGASSSALNGMRTTILRRRVFEPTVPNLLTVFRILLVPVLVAALLSGIESGDLLAAIVFVIASFTDALDGWIARRNKDVTTFGKLMDPLADKLLVTAALVSLVSLDRLQAWVAMVIIAREFAVTGLRQLAMEHGEVIPACGWGKLKTAAQIAMVLALIVVDGSPRRGSTRSSTRRSRSPSPQRSTTSSASGALVHARPSSHSRVET